MKFLEKFPSYNYILTNARESFTRFPLALICPAAAAIAGVYLVEDKYDSAKHILQNVAMVSALGLPLFFTLTVLAEKKLWSRNLKILSQAIGLLLLVIYYLILPEDITVALIHFNRFFLLYLGLHFLIAFSAFTGKNEINSFWQYNKTLFLRFLLAVIYSGVLYVGLAIALAAADHLFGFDIHGRRYAQLWILIVGIFNTWIFIAGIPRDLNNLEKISDYPKGLKVFTQYILLPLVVLYFIILFTYELKIIFTGNWPTGWVGHLVLWYAVVGILSMLLLYPLKDKAENHWIGVFVRWFYYALIPLVPMLFIAIIKRISEYGFTENRYFVLAMAIGLAVVVIYFIISKRKDIRIIPIVLCCLSFLSAFGPWSAFSISRANQQSRLNELLVKNSIFVDGTIQKAPDEINFENQVEISDIIRYLSEFHGPDAFYIWFEDGTLDTLSPGSRSAEIANRMGFRLLYGRDISQKTMYFSYLPKDKAAFKIMDYDYLINFNVLSQDSVNNMVNIYEIENYKCYLSISQENTTLEIKLERTDSGEISEGEIGLTGLLEELNTISRDSSLSVDKYDFVSDCGKFGIRVIFQNIIGNRTAEKYILSTLRGQLLIREP